MHVSVQIATRTSLHKSVHMYVLMSIHMSRSTDMRTPLSMYGHAHVQTCARGKYRTRMCPHIEIWWPINYENSWDLHMACDDTRLQKCMSGTSLMWCVTRFGANIVIAYIVMADVAMVGIVMVAYISMTYIVMIDTTVVVSLVFAEMNVPRTNSHIRRS